MATTRPETPPASGRCARDPWLIALGGAAIAALVVRRLTPKAPPLGTPTGDAELAAHAARVLGSRPGYGAVSVVRITDGQPTWAGFGDLTADSRFELGSITKTFNGMVLADAVERGEVRLDDPVATHVAELSGRPAGSVTLAELASHRGGLPSVAKVNYLRAIAEDLAAQPLSAYTSATPASVVDASRSLKLSGRGRMRYSNLGASLLGIALTRAAGVGTWCELMRQRLWTPLGMHDTEVAEAGRPASDLVQPRQPSGRASAPWTGSGYAPAGIGVTTTGNDLARYALAILHGSAPGMAALTARWPVSKKQHIGLAWLVSDQGVAWHNGGTGGTRTMLAIDLASRSASVVLNASSRDVTEVGLRLLPGS